MQPYCRYAGTQTKTVFFRPKLASLVAQLGLTGAAAVCGQALVGQSGSAMAQDELPTVGKITKSGVKYFDYRLGEGSSPRSALLLFIKS